MNLAVEKTKLLGLLNARTVVRLMGARREDTIATFMAWQGVRVSKRMSRRMGMWRPTNPCGIYNLFRVQRDKYEGLDFAKDVYGPLLEAYV